MKLSDKQFKFAKMTTLLFQWLINNGYKFTIGEVWRPGDKPRRCHWYKLAVDINLFVPIEDPLGEGWVTGYQYTRKTSDHLPAGEFWESIGGSWGGRFGAKPRKSGKPGKLGRDGNHYSVEWKGVK